MERIIKSFWDILNETDIVRFLIDIVYKQIDYDFYDDHQEPAGGSGRDIFTEQHDMNEGQKVTSAENRKRFFQMISTSNTEQHYLTSAGNKE